MFSSTFSTVKSLANNERRPCYGCSRTVAYSKILSGLETYENCRVCLQPFCGNCISKTTPLLIPHQILHPSYHEHPNVAPWVCHKACRATAISYYMMEFREECEKKYEDFIVRYLASEQQQLFYPLPPPSEDTFKRKALRLAQLAEVVVSVTGYNMYVKTLKYAYYGTEFYKLLVEENLLNALKPIVDNLQVFGVIKGSDHRSWIRVYYLAWKHQLEYKTDGAERGREAGEAGVLHERCSIGLLDEVAAFLPAAQFLYAAHLHAPHSNDDMSAWYLSQLVRRQGWTVLIAETNTRRLPDGRKVPAFCLLARSDASGRKEAVLCVRGTQNASDWSINLNEDPAPFAYCTGSGMDTEYMSVTGHVHSGMHQSALGILDEYGLRRYLTDLSSCGYEVTVVGHSLGAGTAVLVAAELKNSFCAAMNKDRLPHTRRVRAVGFGAPPIMCETLSDAMAADELVVSVILDDDVVSRFSRSNIASLAEEVRAFEEEADEWYQQDIADVQAYMQNYGRAAGPSFNPGSAVDEPVQAAVAEPAAAATPVAEGRLVGLTGSAPIAAVPVAATHMGKEGVGEDSAVMKPDANPNLNLNLNLIRLVPAGRIVHIYSTGGAYESALCDHRLQTLRRLKLLAVNGLEDHKLSSYWAALRSLKFKHQFDSSPEHRLEPGLQTRQSIRRAPAEGEVKGAYVNSNDPALWELCSVCNLDCTWAHVSHSGATRARVTHNCSVCGCVVCTVCAPAGDVLAGEGVNQSVTLSDWRLALPSRGMMEKVRVCAHCYLDSYHYF